MIQDFFFILVAATLAGHAIANTFPLIEAFKRMLSIDMGTFLVLEDRHEADPLTGASWMQHKLAKSVNCSGCMAFWSAVAICLTNPQWWHPLPIICAHTAASIIERHLRQQ